MDKKRALIALGARIKNARREHSISQEALASTLNVSSITVSRWETGRQSPDYITLCEIAVSLDVPLSYLIEEPSRNAVTDGLERSYAFRSLKKSNSALEFEYILREIALIDPDIVVMIHELKESWGALDVEAKQVLADGFAFVLGSMRLRGGKTARQ